ncbi:MAG: outer membrane protein [Devosia sp.]|jgi:outer membrane immunogenic protein
MKRLGIMLAAILSLTTATHAADLGWNSGASPIYSPTPATGWSGFYAGVSGGYGFGSATVSPAPGAQASNSTGGWNLGGQAGYNMDMGGFILGAEGDLQWSNIGYSEAIPAGTFKTGIDFYGTLRGRAGMAFGQVMPYVTAGLAAGRGSASLDNGVVTSQSATHMGWTAGVGLEAQATSNISIKAEYLYVDLGTQTYNGLPGPVGNIDVGQRFSVVRAGLNYKF